MKKILVPVDFTDLSEKVTEKAAFLCEMAGAAMVLLHVTDKSSDKASAQAKLNDKAARIKSKYHFECESKVREGSLQPDGLDLTGSYFR
ncbi:MAG: universal stress protein [Bacteroidales bacterium]|nr:universal stress protein [Bacteroidales bacterium]